MRWQQPQDSRQSLSPPARDQIESAFGKSKGCWGSSPVNSLPPVQTHQQAPDGSLVTCSST